MYRGEEADCWSPEGMLKSWFSPGAVGGGEASSDPELGARTAALSSPAGRTGPGLGNSVSIDSWGAGGPRRRAAELGPAGAPAEETLPGAAGGEPGSAGKEKVEGAVEEQMKGKIIE